MTLRKKSIRILLLALVVAALCVVPVFPALTMVLGIAFFVKVALCFFDYRKHGQFEWTGAAILFVCLIFVLLAPNYIWNIVGI